MEYDCRQCGFPSDQFEEGVCPDCHRNNQNALDLHNATYDWWQSLSDTERSHQIKSAYQ